MTDDEIVEAMVNSFLQWKLPDTVQSDLCASDREYAKKFPGTRCGTNLLSADEARQMVEHLLAVARQAIRDQVLDEAAAKYDEFHKWVCDQISTATYNAEELEQGLVGWQPLADTMFNGTMASWESAILALKGSPHAQD